MTGGTTRHTVRLSGGCPWGFRLQGGAKAGQPLTVAKVRRKSKAYEKLYEGDTIISINGQLCERLTHDQAMHIVEVATNELILEIERPESNKENVVPSSAPSASSFVTSSGGQTKITEESHYQRIKQSVIRSESPVAPTSVVKHETTKTGKITTLPSSVQAFQGSLPTPISSISKTKQQEVTEHSTYQQIKSTTVHSDQAQTAVPLRTEIAESQTKPNAEKLLPLCVEAFQDSVLSPISGVKKTKKQEVIENSHYEEHLSSVNHSETSPPVSRDSPRMSTSIAEPRSSVAEKLLPMCVEAFQDSVLSPISGISKTKTGEVEQRSQQSKSIISFRPISPALYRSSPKPWSPTSETTPLVKNVLPHGLEVSRDSNQSPISGIPKSKRQEVLKQSNYQSSSTSVTSLVRCLSPKPWTAPDTETKSPLAETRLPSEMVTEYSDYNKIHQPNEACTTSSSTNGESRIWMCVSEVRSSSQAQKLLPLCVEAFQDSVLSPISGIKKTKRQDVIVDSAVADEPHYEQNIARVRQFWHERTSTTNSRTRSKAAKNLLPLCVEAFQDSVLSPISGTKYRRDQKVAETTYRQQTYSTATHTGAAQWSQNAPKPSTPSAETLLPMCVEAFQDSVLSPISGIRKIKTQEIQSNVVRSVTPPVSQTGPKPWKPDMSAKSSTAEKLLPVCVEAFQDSVLSPISGISKTKKQEIQFGLARSPTPPVANTVPKPWRSDPQVTASPVAAKLLPICVEAFQDSVLSPISGIPKTKKQEISSSPIRSVTPPVLSASPKPWKPAAEATSGGEKLLPFCVEAFQDSVLSPISGISRTKKQETTQTVVTEQAQTQPSSGEKLLPLCVEAFQDSFLSPISGVRKTKNQEVAETADAKTQAQQPSAGGKLLPLCVEAFQDSVLSPISGVKKTKNQEVAQTADIKAAAQPSAGEKILPLCVEAFQDSVLSPISGIKKTKNQEVAEPTDAKPTAEPSAGEKLLPFCVEAFQDSVLSPIGGAKETKKQEVAEPTDNKPAAESSVGEKLIPLCVEAFQDSVLSPISGVKKTKIQEVAETADVKSSAEPSAGEQLLPLCVEAFQDTVLSPISGVKKTKSQEVAETADVKPSAEPSAGEKLLPFCVEAFQDTVLSPISGVKKTKSQEVTTSSVYESETQAQAKVLATGASEPSAREKLLPLCVEAFQDSVLSPISGIKKTKNQELAGAANKPVASAAESAVRQNVYQQSESSTLPRRKKQFSSSSFYEDEYSSFPTIEEQVQLCRQIADSLVDESGKKSKGASMFDRRMKRSTSWVHENPEDDEVQPTAEQTEGKEVADVEQSPRPKSKPSLKLILDPRLPQDVAALKTSGQLISEHNVVSPDICHDLVKDLQSPIGKGGALFAKRKKKADDWVVDDEKVKAHTKTPEPLPEPPVPPLHKLKEKFQNPKLKLVKSPWEAALQSPIGSVDSAFVDVKSTKLAKKAADSKARSNSQSPVSDSGSLSHAGPFTPSASGVYKPITPRGWTGRATIDGYDNRTSGGFTSPELPLMPSQPYSSAPLNKPGFQNFNTTAKSWNEAKRGDSSPSGFKPVRPPTFYAK